MKHEGGDDYFASRALGSTAIRTAAQKSVAHYYADKEKETKAQTMGTAHHAATLEPETIGERLIVAPRCQCQATTKAGKQCSKQSVPGAAHCGIHEGEAEAEAWRASLPNGVVIVPEDVMDSAMEAAVAIRAGIARFGLEDLMRVWHTEVPMFATARLIDEPPGYVIEPEGGEIEVRCKIDFMAGSPVAVIGDLKQAAKGVDPWSFGRVVRSNGYHIQAALYTDIVKALTGSEPVWLWVAHEATKPWGTMVHEAESSDLDIGRKAVNIGIRRWAAYFETGDQWHGWPSEINPLTMPRYREDEEE